MKGITAQQKYFEEAKALSEVIEIAIESLQKIPPKDFNESHLNHVISNFVQIRQSILKPEPRYQNSKSLAYAKVDVLTYFQEGHGETVNYFWKRVAERELGFKRENKLHRILKSGKIRNEAEYNFVIDTLLPYEHEGLMDVSQVTILNRLIETFEKKG